MLKIIKETDPIEVKRLTTCIYAPPGVGKTTLTFTAEKPLLLDFDGGVYRAVNRKDAVSVAAWGEVANLTSDDLREYSTVIVDTAGRALDLLAVDIISKNPKMGYGGALSLQGYGQLKSQFIAWNKLLCSMGKDVILLAHSTEEHKGDEIIERLDVQGGSKNEIYKCADVMGRISIINGKRVLNFNPTDTAFGKNPAGLDAIQLPDYKNDHNADPLFFDGVLKKIKESLNKLTSEQQETMKLLVDWQAVIDGLVTVDDFNNKISETKKADARVINNVKRMLVESAKSKGFDFDTETAQFVAKKAA